MTAKEILSAGLLTALAVASPAASPAKPASVSIGLRAYDALPAAAAAARTGDVIRVQADQDWGKSFLPTGAVVTVDLGGHRVCQYFWLSSGGTLRNGEIVPHAGWAAASFYGDGALENLAVTNAPSNSVLVGVGRENVTVEIRSGDYTTGALLSTVADTAARYRLRIAGGRFAARMWQDHCRALDANVSVSGGKWAYDPTRWLAAGCQVEPNVDADAGTYPYRVVPREAPISK